MGFLKWVGQSVVLYILLLFGSAGAVMYGLGALTRRVNASKALWGYLWPPGKCQGEAFWALRI